MYDYTQAKMNDDAIRAISSIGLAIWATRCMSCLYAHICASPQATGKGLHRATGRARLRARSRRALPKSSYPF